MGTSNNRRFFRVECKTPICTQISIVKFNNRPVTTGTGNICVENISSGGLKFLSSLNLPVVDIMVIDFKLAIEEEITDFYGYIVRKEEIDTDIYRYGVKFVNKTEENEQFVSKLDELNREGIIKSSTLCSGNVMDCIKKNKKEINKRTYKRYKFNNNFVAKMKVDTTDNKSSTSKWDTILINDISAEGIQFTSNFKVTKDEDTLLGFKIIIDNREIYVKGHVLWIEEVGENKYRYGAKLLIPDLRKKRIAEILNGVVDFSSENGLLRGRCISIKFNYPKAEDNKFEWWV